MLVATHYTVSLDIGKGVYVVRNKDAPMCPECGVLMSGYDHRKRKAIPQWSRLHLRMTRFQSFHLFLLPLDCADSSM